MEKQLELKEASTRRKILALKQQLQSGNKLPATAPAKQSVHTSTTKISDTRASIPVSKSDQTILSSDIRNKNGTTARLKNLPIQTPPSLKIQTVQNTFSTTEQGIRGGTQHRGDSERTNKVSAPTEISKTSPPRAPEINRLIISDADPPVKHKFKQETKQVVEQESKTPLVTSPSSRTAHSKSRQKLTLPEEIKETEYMSALQRQKARVSRIRRCIVAATVIQRAWRDYNSGR